MGWGGRGELANVAPIVDKLFKKIKQILIENTGYTPNFCPLIDIFWAFARLHTVTPSPFQNPRPWVFKPKLNVSEKSMECLTYQTMKRDLYPFRANYFKNHAGLALK